jgi:hypothetical protein
LNATFYSGKASTTSHRLLLCLPYYYEKAPKNQINALMVAKHKFSLCYEGLMELKLSKQRGENKNQMARKIEKHNFYGRMNVHGI